MRSGSARGRAANGCSASSPSPSSNLAARESPASIGAICVDTSVPPPHFADYVGDYRARGTILNVGANLSMGFE